MQNDNWYRVDNVAKVFLATHTERDTRSLRVSCILKDEVDQEILKEAVMKTLQSRPQLQVRIRRGIFWHYVEACDALPEVEEESSRPCPVLYGPRYRDLLHFKVSYFGRRINLDIFHALTDGTGALEYLNIIVSHYLKAKYEDVPADVTVGSGAGASDLEEDSFNQFSDSPESKGVDSLTPDNGGKSYHIRGMKLPLDQLQFFEVHLSTGELLKRAREDGTSLTCYLGAQFMMAIRRDMPVTQRKKPICLSIPVNLRNYYPSATNRNFFNSVHVRRIFDGTETVELLAKDLEEQLNAELTEEKIHETMNRFLKLENLFFVRMVPLFIKQPVVRFFSKRENDQVTMVLSNLGRMQPPEALREHIDSYVSFCSTDELFVTVQSYGDDLVLGVSNAFASPTILRHFVRQMTGEGLKVQISSTEVAK